MSEQPSAEKGLPEPMEFGAVVTDSTGKRWVRTSEGEVHGATRPWVSEDPSRWATWEEITCVLPPGESQ